MHDLMVGHEAELWSAVTVLFGFLLNRIFRLKPRLTYSVGHSSNLIVEQPLLDSEGTQISPTQMVRTASITVSNSGLQPDKAVEITFNWKPTVLNVWPARRFEEATGAFGRYSLKLDSLAPGEQFTIEILGINAELPLITSVRSENCVGKLVSMAPQRVWPVWLTNTLIAFMVLGMVTTVYLAVSLIQFIANR